MSITRWWADRYTTRDAASSADFAASQKKQVCREPLAVMYLYLQGVKRVCIRPREAPNAALRLIVQ